MKKKKRKKKKKEESKSQTHNANLQPKGGGGKAYLGFSLSRIASQRISQLGSNPFSKPYVIKRPLENKFDVPELIEEQQLETFEENPEENPNIFMRHFGGITYIDDEGNFSNEVYLCGIIDILQKYNKRKKVENFFKGIKQDTSTISSVPPEQYSRRMLDFLKDKIV